MLSHKDSLETKIQQDIYIHYNNTYCLPTHVPTRCIIWHVPNEGQHKLTNIGVLAGVSDLVLIHQTKPNTIGTHLYIEVKRPNGTQSPKQVEFMQRIVALGYQYHIVRSLDDFKAVIDTLCNK